MFELVYKEWSRFNRTHCIASKVLSTVTNEFAVKKEIIRLDYIIGYMYPSNKVKST